MYIWYWVYTQQIDDEISIFNGDKVTVISVYYFVKPVYIVMLFALGIIWQNVESSNIIICNCNV